MTVTSQSSVDPEDNDAVTAALKSFVPIEKCIFMNRLTSKFSETMRCDCNLILDANGKKLGCLTDCLNRLLYIECSSDCNCGKYCMNKNFQR